MLWRYYVGLEQPLAPLEAAYQILVGQKVMIIHDGRLTPNEALVLFVEDTPQGTLVQCGRCSHTFIITSDVEQCESCKCWVVCRSWWEW